MRMEYVEAVLELVGLVPPGSAVSYGDVAELLGSGGPRQVGSVMSRHGSSVAWWRVLRASGAAPDGHEADALRHYLSEGTALRGNPEEYLRNGESSWRVDLRVARWQPSDADFDRIEALAEGLATASAKMSEANDGMTQ